MLIIISFLTLFLSSTITKEKVCKDSSIINLEGKIKDNPVNLINNEKPKATVNFKTVERNTSGITRFEKKLTNLEIQIEDFKNNNNYYIRLLLFMYKFFIVISILISVLSILVFGKGVYFYYTNHIFKLNIKL